MHYLLIEKSQNEPFYLTMLYTTKELSFTITPRSRHLFRGMKYVFYTHKQRVSFSKYLQYNGSSLANK